MGRKAKLKFEYMGELMTISELMKHSAVDRSTLRDRLVSLKWPIEKALTCKKQRQINGNVPSAGSVAINENKRLRKNKKLKMFAQCKGRCNSK